MSAEFIFGHARRGYGAEFIHKDMMIPKEACYKYIGYACQGNVTRINFDPVGEDLYMLVFTTNHPGGSSVEAREQIFVHGYAFSREEIDEIMGHPESLFKIRYYASVDDYYAGKRTSLDGRGDKSEKVKMGAHQTKIYLGSVLNNSDPDGEMKCQIHHIVQPQDTEKWQYIICWALKLLPEEVRKQISWCVNPYTVEETNETEWNYVSADVYQSFVRSRFEGGKVLDRIVVTDTSIQGDEAITEEQTLCKVYGKKDFRKKVWKEIHENNGDRQMFKELLVNEIKFSENVCLPKHEETSKTKKIVHKIKLLPVLEVVLTIITGIFIFMHFYGEYNLAANYIRLNIHNNVFVFLAQFVFAFTSTAAYKRLKEQVKARKEKGV